MIELVCDPGRTCIGRQISKSKSRARYVSATGNSSCNSLLQKELDAALLLGERGLLDGVKKLLRFVVLLRSLLGFVEVRGNLRRRRREPVGAGYLEHLPRPARCRLRTSRRCPCGEIHALLQRLEFGKNQDDGGKSINFSVACNVV